MGIYLNPTNDKFAEAVNSEIYVDKTGLIAYTNSVLHTLQKSICVSRPRRFGKSLAANMLTAYYSRGCDSAALFSGLCICKDPHFTKYLNKYDVVALNMQEFLSRSVDMESMIALLKKRILWELLGAYPDYQYFDSSDVISTMQDIYQNTHIPFIIIIDEWDCIFREYKNQKTDQELYLDFLRDMLKDKEYIHLAYMTGILPIKKYGTHSALNMFDEFSMIDAGPLADYVGFTEYEVTDLCQKYNMDFDEVKFWYNGYRFDASSVYSPKSVVSCMKFGKIGYYWNQTEVFEALRMYIDLNYEGLKEDVLRMLAGESVPINTGTFSNDMVTFHSKDDVFTLLIHLGYLGYDSTHKNIFIPNHEIQNEYMNAVSVSDWGEVSIALKASAETLEAIWQMRPEQVAGNIAKAHYETSHLQYNAENALSYTISLALYAARNFYTIVRELPTGKGFAALVFLPKKQFPDKPALLLELKWNLDAQSALHQIKEKKYPDSLADYHGNLLLVGINYDKQTREHSCQIEKYTK